MALALPISRLGHLLRPTATIPPPTQELVWSLGSRAEISATIRWPSGVVSPVVECEVPSGVVISDVTAPELAGWERLNDRLRIWFKAETKDPIVKWSGNWPEYRPKGTWELPAVVGATVRARLADDVAWSVEGPPSAKQLPTTRFREIVYVAEGNTRPKLTTYPPEVLSLQQDDLITRVGPVLDLRSTLTLQLSPGRPHCFSLALSGLPSGTEPRIEWPIGSTVAEAVNLPGTRVWLVNLAEQRESTLSIVVHTRLSLKSEATLPTTEILLANVPVTKREHLLVLPDDLAPAPGSGLRPTGQLNEWTASNAEAIRLIENLKRMAPVPPLEDREVAIEAAPQSNLEQFRFIAVGWLLGMVSVCLLVWRGPQQLLPEALAGYGLLCAFAAGWGFGLLALIGVMMRLMIFAKLVGDRVLR